MGVGSLIGGTEDMATLYDVCRNVTITTVRATIDIASGSKALGCLTMAPKELGC